MSKVMAGILGRNPCKVKPKSCIKNFIKETHVLGEHIVGIMKKASILRIEFS